MATKKKRPAKRDARGAKDKKGHPGLWALAVLLLLGAAYMAILQVSRPNVDGDRIRFDSFIEFIDQDRVQTAKLLDEDSYVVGEYTRAEGEPVRKYNAPLLRGYQSRLLEKLVNNEIPTEVDQQPGKRAAQLAASVLPLLALVVLVGYGVVASRRGTGMFKVRSGARKIDKQVQSEVTFANVAGQDAAVAELREITDFLAHPEVYDEIGAEIPKGVLLFGPPGCGKTLLAKALAGEAGASFYSISGSDFVEMYVGVGAARVRDLFTEARENSPSVIFIDEIDSVGRARGGVAGMAGGNSEQEQALNQILAEMDGFSPSEGLIVLAATNRPDILDPALLRPGRFDRTVGLERPDESARLDILSLHAGAKKLEADVDLALIAREAIGLTGADLASVMNEGALLAARAKRTTIAQADFTLALHRVLDAPERQRRLSMRDRSIGRRNTQQVKVTFDDVAGQDAAVAELREIKDYLADPARYIALGANIPRGMLLYGPPGCGKTMLAKAVAGEANAAFISVGASEFIEALVGQGAARVRDLFANAKQMAPAIIFIDEIDSLGRSRSGTAGNRGGSQGEQEQALTQILAEMDGFGTSDAVIVLAATNRPDVLDPALLRPGRFDRTVGLELPNDVARLAILERHAREKVLDPGVQLGKIAERAHGLTGADLANIVNEAALLAARAHQTAVSQEHLDEALQRRVQAPERQRRLSMRAKSVGKRFSGEERITFADVAGVDDALEELRDIKDYLADPERFSEVGAVAPRGILMSGPPGCGKTLLGRAVAGEANAAFISASGTDFVEVFVGEGAARVRDLFAEARSMAPAVVFIDEIDAIGGRRQANAAGGNREAESTLNQLLVELDGFESRTAVIIMAATNRPDMLDPALIRPGRFDRKIEVTVPDRAGRRSILELHSKGKPLASNVDLDVLAGLTRGFSGAELANVMNEAALLCTREHATTITMSHVDQAVDRAMLGIVSKGQIMSEEERKVVAFHEAGHALLARRAEGAPPPYKLSIVPRGGTVGQCSLLDTLGGAVQSRAGLLTRMAVLLGGWAAEKMVFGDAGAGAANDLQRVHEIARRMVCEFGMSDALGPLGAMLAVGPDGRPAPPSAEAALEIRKLADEAYALAQGILEADRDSLYRVAEALLEQETLTADNLEALIGNAPPPPAPPARRRRTNGGTRAPAAGAAGTPSPAASGGAKAKANGTRKVAARTVAKAAPKRRANGNSS